MAFWKNVARTVFHLLYNVFLARCSGKIHTACAYFSRNTRHTPTRPSIGDCRSFTQRSNKTMASSAHALLYCTVLCRRLWMLMPGISLWRVLVHLIGMSLLVSYCVTLTLRAYHSTSCRATFGCEEETDPKLASFREWQVGALCILSWFGMTLTGSAEMRVWHAYGSQGHHPYVHYVFTLIRACSSSLQ